MGVFIDGYDDTLYSVVGLKISYKEKKRFFFFKQHVIGVELITTADDYTLYKSTHTKWTELRRFCDTHFKSVWWQPKRFNMVYKNGLFLGAEFSFWLKRDAMFFKLSHLS
jgi:hypothetical protein